MGIITFFFSFSFSMLQANISCNSLLFVVLYINVRLIVFL